MEMKVIKCPNCGANAKNHTNCEYCGSLLVRFVDKGIDISNTSYKSDVDVLPGLVYDLQKNLKIQKELKGEPVETQVFWCDKDSKWSECDRWDSLRIASPNSYFYNGSQINTEEAVALVLVLNIPLIDNELDTSKNAFNEKGKKLIEEFKQLASYPLFQSKMSEEFSDNGVKWNIWEYYINFGKDVIGAARLTSEILVKLYDIKGYSIYTNEGYAIEEAKEDFLSGNGFNDENSENIDNESDYSEDQEDNSIESLSNWQKVLLAFSLISGVLVGYYVISENLLELGFLWVLIILGPTICAFIPHNYEADIERGEGVINPRNKWVTIVVFIISLISIIFICPSLLKQMESNDSPNTEHLKEETSDAEAMKQEKVTDGSQSSENQLTDKQSMKEKLAAFAGNYSFSCYIGDTNAKMFFELSLKSDGTFSFKPGNESTRELMDIGKVIDGLDYPDGGKWKVEDSPVGRYALLEFDCSWGDGTISPDKSVIQINNMNGTTLKTQLTR